MRLLKVISYSNNNMGKDKSKTNKADLDRDDNSDIDDVNFDDFKGIYFGDKTEKYQDPQTGCHFRYQDLC